MMFSLFASLGVQTAFRREFIPFLAAFAIAEAFYKFHSFALECVAFLATWFVLSYLTSLIFRDKVRDDAAG